MTMISPKVKLRAEYKALISLLSVSLEFSRTVLSKTVRLTVEPHQITIESKCGKYVFELEGLTLLPASCRGLRWGSPTELQLSLQVKHNDGVDCNGAVDHKSSTNNQDALVSRIQLCQNHCHCVGCGVKIFKSSSHFKRVLPLPSENWSDFADIWFCHNHSHSASDTQQGDSHSCSGDGSPPEIVTKLKKFPMLPRADDCLVSSLYMLVDSSHVKTSCVIQTADRLICKRCCNFIGFVKDETTDATEQTRTVYKIYHHAVGFKDGESNGCPKTDLSLGEDPDIISSEKQQHIEDFMCCLLRDQSKLFTSFRFILSSSLQAKDQSSISVLLWLLDQELNVFSAHSHSPPSDDDSAVKASSKRYMKLLYKATFTTFGEYDKSESSSKVSDVFKAWRLDNTVHSISLPYPLCKQLIHLLVTSTKTLTKSQRSLNGFHVGYLKVS